MVKKGAKTGAKKLGSMLTKGKTSINKSKQDKALKGVAKSAAVGGMTGAGGGKSMKKMASKIAKAGALGKGLRKGLTGIRKAQAGIKNARKKVKAGKGYQK